MNQSASSFSWDDLRIALAVAREGSVRAAAKQLLLSHATVSRRLAELSERAGVRLFARDGRRLRPTTAGLELVESAQRIEAEVDRVGLRVAGQDLSLRGTVRVALPSSMLRVLAPEIARMRDELPEIRLEIDTRLELSNLTRREADVAVRLTDAPQETLVGRKVGPFRVVAFGRRELIASGRPLALPWVDWDEHHRGYRPARWVARHVPSASVRATADSEIAMLDLAREGVGVAFLPWVLASEEPLLVPVPGVPSFETSIWVLTHPDLRQAGRVRVVMQRFGDALAAIVAR